MQLQYAAKRFDTTPVFDAYTGDLQPHRCQVTLWDNPRRDGLTTLRRTISAAKEFEPPPRRAVVIGKEAWIIGTYAHPDTFDADIVRRGYVMQLAQPGAVGTTKDFFDDTYEPVYVSRVWVKDVKDTSTESEAQSQYYIYFTEGENVQEGEFIFVHDRLHIVRNVKKEASGLWAAEANELEYNTFGKLEIDSQQVFDPVTETYTGGAPREVKAIVLKWNDDYQYELPSHTKFEVGDVRVRILGTDTPTLDQTVTFEGQKFRPVSITSRGAGINSVVLRRV